MSQLARSVPFLVILAVAVAGFILFRDYPVFEWLSDNRARLLAFRDANYVLSAIVFVAAYTGIVTFSLPGAAVASITGGFLFNLFPGTLFNMIAATTGATAIFLAARWGFGARLEAKLEASEGKIKRLKDGIDENQWSMLFVMRLVPVVPFFVANLIPSFLGVPLYRFVVSTFFGIVPGALVYTSIGSGVNEIFERGELPDLGIIFSPAILLPMLGLAALSLMPVFIKVIRGKDKAI